jgi:UPF0755 protein
MMKRLYKIAAVSFAGLMLVLGIAVYLVYKDYLLFLSTPVTASEWPVMIDVPAGSNFSHLLNDLSDRQIVDNKKYLKWYGRSENITQKIKAGHYAFNKGITPVQLLDKIVKGEVVNYAFTIVEGRTFRQMLAGLQSHDRIEKQLADLNDEAIVKALGLPYDHPEGLFLPDTYLFPLGTTDMEYLSRAAQAMQNYLQLEWDKREQGLPIKSPYEALILASIVEKETGVTHERPEIAGVFVRRLIKGMRLQTDPTVIYGMGESFDGNIRRKDLRQDTPYNTYTRYGLPPTPIALPGKAAIHAVLHPAKGNTLYFVAKGDGSHHFSATLEEHNRAVRKYQLRK